jgi:hypothetical protein
MALSPKLLAHGHPILDGAQMLHVNDVEGGGSGLERLLKLLGQGRHPAVVCLQGTVEEERLEHIGRRASSRQPVGQHRHAQVSKILQLTPLPF